MKLQFIVKFFQFNKKKINKEKVERKRGKKCICWKKHLKRSTHQRRYDDFYSGNVGFFVVCIQNFIFLYWIVITSYF